jgi:transcriptional regulator with XRE-family HTH domain
MGRPVMSFGTGSLLGDYIVERRKALGLTQLKAAEALGVDHSTVSGWEKGTRPQGRHLPGLAAWLGLEIAEVIDAQEKGRNPIMFGGER